MSELKRYLTVKPTTQNKYKHLINIIKKQKWHALQ